MIDNEIRFGMPKKRFAVIKVFGVGGGGSNAVNHLFRQGGGEGVDLIVCNTDGQALEQSPVPEKIQLGLKLTEGLGAGGDPEIGRMAAMEDVARIKEILTGSRMAFVTAGLGGGTGTGGAPVIAALAKEEGILTVGIVTIPFAKEGPKKRLLAQEGLEELRKYTDAVIVICNDKLRDLYGNLSLTEAFQKADDVLSSAAKGIAQIINVHGKINVDFNDVRNAMQNSGVAIMGYASAEGEERSLRAVQQALSSPLLNDNNVRDARYVLLNITSGEKEALLDEIAEIVDYVQEEAGSKANIIMGIGTEPLLGEKISVTIIASGFPGNPDLGFTEKKPKVVKILGAPASSPGTNPGRKENGKDEKEMNKTPKRTPASTGAARQGSLVIEWPSRTTSSGTRPPEKDFLIQKKSQETPPSRSENPEAFRKRIDRIGHLSGRFKTAEGIAEMENVPAFKRRNVKLEEVPHSSQTNVSRYTISESDDEQGSVELRPNNPYLHDNVD